MKILLAALNAKFIHTNLAIRDLKQMAVGRFGIPDQAIVLREFTINQYPADILGELSREAPDVLCFSAYIWNIGEILEITQDFKLIYPEVPIILGGPEVSYDTQEFLQSHRQIDGVLVGEGEIPFGQLCRELLGQRRLEKVASLVWRESSGEIKANAPAQPLDLSLLVFPYERDLSDAGGRILYYESSRGCPFQCQYCLSSEGLGVRFRPLGQVLEDLRLILNAAPRLLKFVDRTFNCQKQRALAIWRYLSENDNGITQFHFELSADLLDEECLDFLEGVRPGLFQFEIGVQSTNESTVHAIRRAAEFEGISRVVRRLRRKNNIPLHLDLIAGLPFEDYDSFGRSFDDVMALRPHQLQLGFLKLLKGSGLRRDAQKYGITYSPRAPYEVLATREMPYGDLARLKDIEEMTELYYNSASFQGSLEYLMALAESPFRLFEALARFYRREGFAESSHSRYELYDILDSFAQNQSMIPNLSRQRLRELMLFDLCRHEKPRKLPGCLGKMEELPSVRRRSQVLRLYEDEGFTGRFLPEYQGLVPQQLCRSAHIEFFSFDPRRFLSPISPASLEEHADGTWMVVFNYRKKDIMGNAGVLIEQEDTTCRETTYCGK